jgi:DNA-directed RNA polymerase specialized sigma subunit
LVDGKAAFEKTQADLQKNKQDKKSAKKAAKEAVLNKLSQKERKILGL